ncbi:MAG: tetratricopeptide repeat protein [Trueperaceae bacterium]|nr:tetratricopeptide repeat protein [Trueperaceae bacterium]
MSLRVQLLGPLELFYQNKRLDETIDRKSLALLAYLAVTGVPASREELAELLWGQGKLNNLRQALYKLRQLPGADDWLRDDEAIELIAETDLEQFENHFKSNNFGEALKLCGGNLLAGFKPIKADPFMNWLELERGRLSGIVQELQQTFLEELEASGNYDEALELARELLQNDPLNETVHRSIMRLEHALGHTEAALEQFEVLRENLKTELDLEPLDETLDLLAEIEAGGAGSGELVRLIAEVESLPHLANTFIGRAEVLGDVQKLLHQTGQVLIQGFGGMGKSALAAQVALNYLDEGKVLWLEPGQNDLASILNALFKVFDIAQEIYQQQDQARLLSEVLEAEAISIIILDDIWNAYTLSSLLALLPDRFPVLITSRQRYPRLKRISLGRLERPEALALLSHFADVDLGKAGDALAEQLGDHAYALRVAGLNLRHTGQTPDELLATIKNAPHDLRIPDELRAEEQGSIAQLLQVSLEVLDDPSYEAFLGFGALPRASASPELLARMMNRDLEYLEDALFTLSQHGLASLSSLPGSDFVSYQIHNLAHSYVQAINNYRLKTVNAAVKSYLQSFTHQAEAVQLELQTMLSVAEKAEGEDLVELMRLLVLEGSYYLGEGHSSRSLRLLERAATEAEPNLSHEFLAKIGNHYLNYLGQHDFAHGYFERAYQVAKRLGDVQRQAVYQCLMAVILLRRSDPAAESAFEKAYRLLPAGVSLDAAIVLANYGYFYAMQGVFERAQQLFETSLRYSSSLDLANESQGLEAARIQFFALNNLAQILHDLKDYESSVERRNEALELAKRFHNKLWMADAYYGLGESYHALLKREQAQAMLAKALQAYETLRAEAYAAELRQFMTVRDYELLA